MRIHYLINHGYGELLAKIEFHFEESILMGTYITAARVIRGKDGLPKIDIPRKSFLNSPNRLGRDNPVSEIKKYLLEQYQEVSNPTPLSYTIKDGGQTSAGPCEEATP